MNNPFDRTILHPLEKPLADDINQLATNFDQALRFMLGALFSDPDVGGPRDGFLGTGLLASAASTPDMTVTVSAGLGFQTQVGTEMAISSVPGLNDLATFKPIPLLANQVFTVPTAPAGPLERIDIIEVKADRVVTDPSSRRVFNEALGQFQPGTVNKTLAWALDDRAGTVNSPSDSSAPLSYKVGVAANPAVAPSVTPGYIKIAEIAVGSDVITIGADDITDYREVLTERKFKVLWPASNGFNGSGGTPQAGGKVLVTSSGVWYMNIGAGLEAGDIIEDIVTVFEKTSVTSNDLQSRLQYQEVDIDAGTITDTVVGYASTGAQTDLGVYTTSHATAFPASFPIEVKAGFTGTVQFDSDLADDTLVGAYALVRRASIKRDS